MASIYFSNQIAQMSQIAVSVASVNNYRLGFSFSIEILLLILLPVITLSIFFHINLKLLSINLTLHIVHVTVKGRLDGFEHEDSAESVSLS